MPGTEQTRAYLADREVPCPGCGYNLRGVAEPVCPECGEALSVRSLAAWQKQMRETPGPHACWLLVCGTMVWLSMMVGLEGTRPVLLGAAILGLGGIVPMAAYIVLATIHRRVRIGTRFKPGAWLFLSPIVGIFGAIAAVVLVG